MAEEEKIELDEKPSKKKGLPMIVILLLVAAISGGGGIAVYKFILAPKGKAKAETAAPVTEEKKGEEAAKAEGGAETPPPAGEVKQEGESAPATTTEGQAQVAVLSLKEFIVNLNDPIGRRYLKTEIKLELNMKAAAAKIQGDELILSRLRDIIFLILSSKSYEDLRSITGKLTLKEEIVAKSNEVLSPVFGKNIVSNCYFTDFVVQ